MKQKKGYVQIYTGSGKGKTTASLGLTLRAAGAGMKVFIGQFLKTGTYSEIKGLSRFEDMVTVEQFGSGKFIRGNPTDKDKKLAAEGFEKLRGLAVSGEYDLIVLEEINVAVHIGLIPAEEVLSLIREKHPGVELVLTGRYAKDEIIAAADLVTEMKCIKHYFDQGVQARTGIEK